MTRPRETSNDTAFDDFLWEIDVTRRRPMDAQPAPATAPSAPASPARASAPAAPEPPRRYRSVQPRPPEPPKRWRPSGLLLGQIGGGILLLAGTVILVTVALTR